MANGHGGPRTPSNPAPVSAPGALSRRTDGGPQQVNAQMTGMNYGENADFMDIQSSAPMSATPSVRAPRGGAAASGPSATPLFSQTQRPDEPVTAGAPFGPGSTPSVPDSFQNANSQDVQLIKQRYLPSLLQTAQQENVPPSFVRFVNNLKGM